MGNADMEIRLFPTQADQVKAERTRYRMALKAIHDYAKPPHPEPCGTGLCLLCLIESTASQALEDR